MTSAKPKFEAGHCPKCGAKQAVVVTQHIEKIDHPDFDGATEYSVVQCGGCGEFYFKSSHWNSEDIDYIPNEYGEVEMVANETKEFWPPASERRPPEWLTKLRWKDATLWKLFRDVFVALSNDLRVLAAIGMRTTFDRASELLGVDTELSFDRKLKELKSNGIITDKERTVLGVLVDAGSAAAHRGWEPSTEQLEAMITLLESFLHRSFLLEEIGNELRGKVPSRGS